MPSIKKNMILSIYIPITRVDFLDETFSTVVNQTSDNYEVLAMDNTIGKSEIVEEKFKKFFDGNKRASLIKTPRHLGDGDPTESWNYGLEFIKTEYFVLLGDDDALANNYVEIMTSLISRHFGSPVFRCNVNLINEHNIITKYGQKLPQRITWDEYIYNRRTYGLIQSTSELCLNTEQLRKIGGYLSYPYAIFSDDATYITLMLSGEMISTNETFAYWRRHGKNLSMTVPFKIRQKAIRQFKNYVEFMLKTYKHNLDDNLVLTSVNFNSKTVLKGVIKKHLYGFKFIRKLYGNKPI